MVIAARAATIYIATPQFRVHIVFRPSCSGTIPRADSPPVGRAVSRPLPAEHRRAGTTEWCRATMRAGTRSRDAWQAQARSPELRQASARCCSGPRESGRSPKTPTPHWDWTGTLKCPQRRFLLRRQSKVQRQFLRGFSFKLLYSTVCTVRQAYCFIFAAPAMELESDALRVCSVSPCGVTPTCHGGVVALQE
jgi:hypothetical protein